MGSSLPWVKSLTPTQDAPLAVQLLLIPGGRVRDLALWEELPLTEEERAVVDDDLTGYEHLLAQLANVPALDGATPRQLMS